MEKKMKELNKSFKNKIPIVKLEIKEVNIT